MLNINTILTIYVLFMSSVKESDGRIGGDSISISHDNYEIENHRLLSTYNFTCTFAPEDCNNNGVCNQAGTACICDDDYATHDATAETGECNYERKSGLVALLNLERCTFILEIQKWDASSYFWLGFWQCSLEQYLEPVADVPLMPPFLILKLKQHQRVRAYGHQLDSLQ